MARAKTVAWHPFLYIVVTVMVESDFSVIIVAVRTSHKVALVVIAEIIPGYGFVIGIILYIQQAVI